jgi:hypothetical protein
MAIVPRFAFDDQKSAEQNIADFMSFIDTQYPQLGPIFTTHIQKILPLSPEPNKRAADRASFNREIRKILDAVCAAAKAKS